MTIVDNKISHLQRLVATYPDNLPIKVAADFLNMNEEGLKAALMSGNAPFGFGYQKHEGGNRVFVIPAAKFYIWYTGGMR